MAKGDRSWQRSRIQLYESETGLAGISMLGRYDYIAASESSLKTHVHEGAIEICYLVKGRQIYSVDQEIYNIHGGEIFVAFPNESHDSAGEPESKAVLYWIIIKTHPLPDRLLHWVGEEAYLVAGLLNDLPFRHFVAPANSQQRLERLFFLYKIKDDRLRRIKMSTVLASWLLDLIESSHNRTNQKFPDDICRCMNFIRANMDKWLTAKELSEICGLSISRFKEKFRQETGVPPGEFILREKVSAAKNKLKNTDCSITDLAYGLGFSTSQYFSTVFRRFTAMSPRQFRDKNR